MDYNALINFKIPQKRQKINPLNAVQYAVSIGLGQDPTDAWELQFVDEGNGPEMIPSYCTVLGHPGFWLSDPKTTVDSQKVVHVDQKITIKGSIPKSGIVVGKTRIIELVDKGLDKGALLYLEKILSNEDTGEIIAIENRTLMLRGDGGYNGPSGKAKTVDKFPTDNPDHVIEINTRPEQALIYRLNGDPNPLHIDPAHAKKAGFEKPILHGLCTFGIVCQILLRTLHKNNHRNFRDMSARFSKPVFPGELIEISIWENGHFNAKVKERDVIVLSNGFIS